LCSFGSLDRFDSCCSLSCFWNFVVSAVWVVFVVELVTVVCVISLDCVVLVVRVVLGCW